jgi:hypothetical protein
MDIALVVAIVVLAGPIGVALLLRLIWPRLTRRRGR